MQAIHHLRHSSEIFFSAVVSRAVPFFSQNRATIIANAIFASLRTQVNPSRPFSANIGLGILLAAGFTLMLFVIHKYFRPLWAQPAAPLGPLAGQDQNRPEQAAAAQQAGQASVQLVPAGPLQPYSPAQWSPAIDRSLPMCQMIELHLAQPGFNIYGLYNGKTLLNLAIHSVHSQTETVVKLIERGVRYDARSKDIPPLEFRELIFTSAPGPAMEGLLLSSDNNLDLLNSLMPLATLQTIPGFVYGDTESRMAGSIILTMQERFSQVIKEKMGLPEEVAGKLNHTATIVLEYIHPTLPREIVDMIRDIHKDRSRVKTRIIPEMKQE